MAILIDEHTRAVEQGLTCRIGRFQNTETNDYGTTVYAGATPGTAGEQLLRRPACHNLKRALAGAEAHTTPMLVPPDGAGMRHPSGWVSGMFVVADATSFIRPEHGTGPEYEELPITGRGCEPATAEATLRGPTGAICAGA